MSGGRYDKDDDADVETVYGKTHNNNDEPYSYHDYVKNGGGRLRGNRMDKGMSPQMCAALKVRSLFARPSCNRF
jgi:hypothetical protein